METAVHNQIILLKFSGKTSDTSNPNWQLNDLLLILQAQVTIIYIVNHLGSIKHRFFLYQRNEKKHATDAQPIVMSDRTVQLWRWLESFNFLNTRSTKDKRWDTINQRKRTFLPQDKHEACQIPPINFGRHHLHVGNIVSISAISIHWFCYLKTYPAWRSTNCPVPNANCLPVPLSVV